MKLAAQYSKASIIITVCILIAAGIVYYITISYISSQLLDRDLSEEIGEVNEYIAKNNRLPVPVEFDEDQTNFVPIGKATVKTYYTDTPYVDKSGKQEAGRAIVGTVKLHGFNYKVTIVESKETSESLVGIISLITGVLSILLIAALLFTNMYLLDRLWQPFYRLLQQLKTFTVTSNAVMPAQKINIDEFAELQEAISTMSQRVHSEYESLKSFTENASHEMMTPMAVITNKLDTLIQDEELNSAQFEQLHEIYQSVNKLSRLNQALLLLVKIDNQLIKDNTEISLKALLEEKERQFQEILQSKHLELTSNLAEKKIYANSYLIDTLLNNLFSNAIRHNHPSGKINVTLTGQQLVIQNTGTAEPLDGNRIFDRFEKSQASEGTGLGLTIARNICNSYGYTLRYQYMQPYHRFIIDFIG